jgi:hypothetical protein
MSSCHTETEKRASGQAEWMATDVACVVVIAAVVNWLFFVFGASDFLDPDSATYLVQARNLIHGLGFVSEPGVAETLRTPGYPLLLAVFNAQTQPVIVLQHLIAVTIAAVIYLLSCTRFSRSVGLIAALLYATDAATLHCANQVMTETLFTLLLFITIVLITTNRVHAAGLLSGILVLVRPIAIAYFIVVAVMLLAKRKRAKAVTMYTALALLTPLAWALRNGVESGVFSVSSIAGVNLIEYRAAGTLAMLSGDDFNENLARAGELLTSDANRRIEAICSCGVEDLPDAQRAAYYSRYAVNIVLQHPIAFIGLTLRGVMLNLLDTDFESIQAVSRIEASFVRATLESSAKAILIFALFGAVALRRDALVLLAAVTVLYFVVMAAGGEAEVRFRVPVTPELSILAAVGIEHARQTFRIRLTAGR